MPTAAEAYKAAELEHAALTFRALTGNSEKAAALAQSLNEIASKAPISRICLIRAAHNLLGCGWSEDRTLEYISEAIERAARAASLHALSIQKYFEAIMEYKAVTTSQSPPASKD